MPVNGSRKGRRPRSEDLDTPDRLISNVLFPEDISQHAADKYSDILEVDDERLDEELP